MRGKFLIFLIFLLQTSYGFSLLLRNSGIEEQYCSKHLNLELPPYYKDCASYIPLIPQNIPKERCWHLDCPRCGNCSWYEDENYDEDGNSYLNINPYCSCKLNGKYYSDDWIEDWKKCYNCSIYPGYFNKIFIKYFSCFKEYLEYIADNNQCDCYWPELSKTAGSINNLAYNLFNELFESTALSNFVENTKTQFDFFHNDKEIHLSKHGLVLTCIVHSFFFSDYDWICRDIEFYSQSHFNRYEYEKINTKIEKIREILAPLFVKLYQNCLSKHYSLKIQKELELINLQMGSILSIFPKANFLKSLNEVPIENDKGQKKIILSLPAQTSFENQYIFKNEEDQKIPHRPVSYLNSDINLQQGILLNESLLYTNAIQFLTQAIKHNPTNRIAYIERALAYFESNQLILALKDYETAKNLTFLPPFILEKPMAFTMGEYTSESKIEFSKGLLAGTLAGAETSSIEMLPSILSCCRGIFNGLWAFTCSPLEVGEELVNTTFALGQFIYNNSSEECIQTLIPEIRELSNSWNSLNNYSKGQKIGLIIGKYGIDIFAPFAAIKGLNKVRALKQANTMRTLESCILPQKQVKILEESTKRALIRSSILNSNKGKILVKSSNVQFHVMQKKHAWDKLISLSGNVEEDFRKVIYFLEENQVITQKNLINVTEFPVHLPIKTLQVLEYNVTINGHQIEIFLEKYLETSEIYLKNAWIKTK